MSWTELNESYHRAFSVAACMGTQESLNVMRDLLNHAINEDMGAEEFMERLEKTGPHQMLQKASLILDEGMQGETPVDDFFEGNKAVWAFKQLSQFVWDEWGISDTSVSIRILHCVALGKAQPAKLLAGLFHSLSMGDVEGGSK
jgi:hypothetical protein